MNNEIKSEQESVDTNRDEVEVLPTRPISIWELIAENCIWMMI